MFTKSRNSFVLNPDNIQANRQGRLTEQQQNKMRDIRLDGAVGSVFAIFLLAGSMLFLLVNMGQGLDAISLISLEGVLAMISILVGVYGIARWRRFTDDLEPGHIAYITGRIAVNSYREGKSLRCYYYVVIKGIRFDITAEIAKKLDTTREHKLYFAQNSKLPLSIETI